MAAEQGSIYQRTEETGEHTGGIRINIDSSLHTLLNDSASAIQLFPSDPEAWRNRIHSYLGGSQIDVSQLEVMHGGHRNLVLRNREDNIMVIWRGSEQRWAQILRSVSLEDCMARHFSIPGRMLVDSTKPVEITRGGLFITNTNYVEGRYTYPWNIEEIASAAKLMGKLHEALRHVSFHEHGKFPSDPEEQLLHLDFGRGNVLFDVSGGSDAVAVIDYENAAIGPIEQDLGRTASLLLVDSQLQPGMAPTSGDYEQIKEQFTERFETWVQNYPQTGNGVNREAVILWTGNYLLAEDYGSLNVVRDMALKWIKETFEV